MSGILGIWNLDGRPVERTELSGLCATLSHRGNDGAGLRIEGSAGFACQLLRITPEAATETQPLVDSSGVFLVFDGRLDDRDALLTALGPSVPVSHMSPDPALALAAYHAFGDDFPVRLNGDFALGLFDPRRAKLLLARDAVGLRPIYYYASREVFLFASEIKTLLTDSRVVSRPDDDVLADFLFKRLAREDTRGVTFFRNIFSVLPAHLVIATPEKVLIQRYWDFNLQRQERFASIEDCAEAFRQHFERAVRRRLRSAGPVAVSVSGGLDSSAIFCVGETVRRSEPGRHPPLLGVSQIFPDGSPSDEKAFLVEIERAYGVTIGRLENPLGGIMDGCEEAIRHVEAPFLDAQWNRTHACLTALRRRGARVLLTGHWGDQFLFDDAYLVDLCHRGAWREAWSHVNEYGRWITLPNEGYFKRRLFNALLREHAPEMIVSALRRVRDRFFPSRNLLPWYTEAFRSRASANGSPHGSRPRSGSAHAQSLYREARSRYHVLCMEWNNKIAAMHGLEIAFPFLDRDLIAFLLAIPGEMQSGNGVCKGLLREALRGVLPEAIARRRSKADFTRVANESMADDYEQLVKYLRASGMVAALGYADTAGVEALARRKPELDDSTGALSWALRDLLALELWLHGFFGPQRP